ncbi:hypothetical protein TUM17568_34410 [Klebsiella oxytoca]|nr:hypothetical protein TUM17568_34410 [Klebsiella oxytoca]
MSLTKCIPAICSAVTKYPLWPGDKLSARIFPSPEFFSYSSGKSSYSSYPITPPKKRDLA